MRSVTVKVHKLNKNLQQWLLLGFQTMYSSIDYVLCEEVTSEECDAYLVVLKFNYYWFFKVSRLHSFYANHDHIGIDIEWQFGYTAREKKMKIWVRFITIYIDHF